MGILPAPQGERGPAHRRQRTDLACTAHAPWAGHWYLPAGYVEVDETPEEAAARETREECGLEVRVGPLLAVYAFDDDPRGNGLLIVYRGEIVGGTLQPSHEARAVRFFAASEIPEALAGSAHERAIRTWQRGGFEAK